MALGDKVITKRDLVTFKGIKERLIKSMCEQTGCDINTATKYVKMLQADIKDPLVSDIVEAKYERKIQIGDAEYIAYKCEFLVAIKDKLAINEYRVFYDLTNVSRGTIYEYCEAKKLYMPVT